MIAKDDFLALSHEQKIETYIELRKSHKIRDIVEAWEFNNAASLYQLLRQVKIYEQVIFKQQLFRQILSPASSLPSEPTSGKSPVQQTRPAAQPVYGFTYALNHDEMDTQNLADRLERVAAYLRHETGLVRIALSLSGSSSGPDEPVES
ncbi:hypothetical protein [Paenibacillus pasadenensis]|uniref:hypothetical protein n=1 Tax=Paenibacillus pasadenensis TaxID=217090 RepID=UPI0011AED0B0|nr:hypothetical protein [Paenibacillus pasadenensis]